MAQKELAKSKASLGRTISSVVLVLVAGVVLVLIIASSVVKPPISDKVQYETMTMGDTKAPRRHYIMYTDIMCPYCDVFSRATMQYGEEFAAYLEEHDILFEIRMTDMLSYNGSKYSHVAAEGAYCAAEQDKFWDYYHGVVAKLWDDYHSKGIGDSKTSPAISDMTNDWWLSIADKAGLNDEWRKCVTEGKHAEDIDKMTIDFSKLSAGLPYFDWNGKVYNGLPTAGFNSWAELKAFLDTGL